MSVSIQSLAEVLWPHGSGPDCPQAYAVLDGARDNSIAPMVWASGLPYTCLYSGPLRPALMSAAPYLVQIAPESRFFNALVPKAWGQSWGVFVVAQPDVTLQALRRHCRTLLRVTDEQGRSLMFRYYDPRVLRSYLPTCNRAESKRFLGPVNRFLVESDSADQVLTFTASKD